MRLSGLSIAARLVFVAAGSCSSVVVAQDARQFRENGVDYVETVQYASEPVATTQVDRREETVYREEIVTEMREHSVGRILAIEIVVVRPALDGCRNAIRGHGLAVRDARAGQPPRRYQENSFHCEAKVRLVHEARLTAFA